MESKVEKMKYEVKYHPKKNIVVMKLEGKLKLVQAEIPLNNAVNPIFRKHICKYLILIKLKVIFLWTTIY